MSALELVIERMAVVATGFCCAGCGNPIVDEPILVRDDGDGYHHECLEWLFRGMDNGSIPTEHIQTIPA